MIHAPKTVYDGFDSLAGGNQGAGSPLLTPIDAVYRAVNCQFRGMHVRPRPAFKKIKLRFPKTETEEDHVTAYVFRNSRHQVSMVYEPDDGRSYILTLAGGRLYRIDLYPTEGVVTEITPRIEIKTTADFVMPGVGHNVSVAVSDITSAVEQQIVKVGLTNMRIKHVTEPDTLVLENMDGVPGQVVSAGTTVYIFDVNSPLELEAWCVQAEKYAIFRDSKSLPYIWDGLTARRSNPSSANREVGRGRQLAYGWGRLVSVNPDGKTYRLGNLIYSTDPTSPADVLYQTEYDYIGNGEFNIPGNVGKITALAFTATLDQSLGQGPLQIFTRNVIFSVTCPNDLNPITGSVELNSAISMFGFGACGQNGVIQVNGDLYYRAPDGIRSFIMARREYSGWSNTPLSEDVAWVLNADDPGLLQYASWALWNNFLICTCSPVYTERGVYHRGLVSIDLAPMTTIREKKPPIWNGLWTGLNTLQLFTGTFSGYERAFAWALNGQTGELELWEIVNERYDDGDKPITFSFVTRAMQFGEGGAFVCKRLDNGELWINDLHGKVVFDVKYQPDAWPCPIRWAEWTEENCEPHCQTTDPIHCMEVPVFHPGYRNRMGTGRPEKGQFDGFTGQSLRDFYYLRIWITVTGYCEIARGRFRAEIVEEKPFASLKGCETEM